MAQQLKPAYLIHGDDHGAIAERRAGLRALAESWDGGAAALELLEGDASTPAAAAHALAAMTLVPGHRVIVLDGVERWREKDVAEQLLPALASIPPGTTIALFAREEQRTKAPGALHEAVRAAGGQVVEQSTVKPWQLGGWAREQAARLGLALDPAAAKALVLQVGERQQRLLRELEKLALESGPEQAGGGAGADSRREGGAPIPIDAEQIERRAAHSAEQRVFSLADALVAGDRAAAVRSYVRLRAQGERPTGMVYVIASRLRDALAVGERLRAGESSAEIRRSLRMPQRAAERFLADVAKADPQRLRRGLAALADLELDSRGGAPSPSSRSPVAGMGEDTLALRAIEAVTGGG